MPVIKFPSRKLNKNKIIIFTLIFSISFILLILSIIYSLNSSFREFIDIYIFRKEINSNTLSTIELSNGEDHYLHAYDKYIAVLDKKILYTYNDSGEIISENDINISSPIFANQNKFLVIAENNGNNIYLVSGTNILWHNTVDGNISKISVNRNGYVSVIISGTNYKSIVVSFNPKGNELFKTYISNNLAICTDISNDNKYLSIAEVCYTGSIIKSAVKNISIEKVKNDPTNSVIYTYNFKDNELLTHIKYQDKNNLICQTTTNVYSLNILDSIDSNLLEINNEFEFLDIKLKNNLIYTYNKNQNFNNTSYINIFNTQNTSLNTYEFKGSIESIYTSEERIAINTGSEVHFIGLNGWLIKKYSSYNEINNIILGDSVAGIIYKDKVIIIEI